MKKLIMLLMIAGCMVSSCSSSYRATRKADPQDPKYAPVENPKPGNGFQNQR